MEILINELSLCGQFATIDLFVKDFLIPFVSILKELDKEKDTLFKKQNFWNSQITSTQNLNNILTQKSDEVTRFKSLLSNLINKPFWEDTQKHNECDIYEYSGINIVGSSVAESCERDKIVISFSHENFSKTKLNVTKNNAQIIEIDNLFEKTHYIEVAYNRRQFDKCEYLQRKVTSKLITLLENEYLFSKTDKIEQGQRVYKEIETGYYWYLDNFHKNHYEVFNSQGKHIGEANLHGHLDMSKQDNMKTLNK